MNNVDNACNYNKQNKTQQMLTALPLPLTKGYAEGQGGREEGRDGVGWGETVEMKRKLRTVGALKCKHCPHQGKPRQLPFNYIQLKVRS